MPSGHRLVALLFVLPYAVGLSCDGANSDPTLRLSDASHTGCAAPEETLEPPIALGARLAVLAVNERVTPPVGRAESSNPDVLAVEAIGNPVLVRAVTPGIATLNIWDTALVSGSAPLSVAEVVSVTAELDGLMVFNLDVNLETPFTATATGLVEAGVALLPDGIVRVRPVFRDIAGRELLGHDLATWSSSPPALSWTYPEPYSDSIDVTWDVTWDVTSAGSVSLQEGGGSVLTLTLQPSGATASMTAYWPETGALGGTLSIADGEIRTVVGILRDASGRLLLGQDGAPFEAEAMGENIRVVPPPWSEGEAGVEMTPALQALLTRLRVTWIEGVHPGTTELVLLVAGTSVSIDVTVTE